MSQQDNKEMAKYFYWASAADFGKIPGSPIAYWLDKKIIKSFDAEKVELWTISEGQNKTANNEKYVRNTWEVSLITLGRNKKWLPYAKGGDYRKWYGNKDYLVDWSETARDHYKKDSSCRIIPEYLWYRKGISWTLLTSSNQSFRLLDEDETFDMTGSSVFVKDEYSLEYLLAFLNCKISAVLNKTLNPTLALQIKNVRDLPIIISKVHVVVVQTLSILAFAKTDWNSYENSWNFTRLPLLHADYRQPTLKASNESLRIHWFETTLEMQRLEEENNRIFIDAYGLQDELTPEVPLSEITLTCNCLLIRS